MKLCLMYNEGIFVGVVNIEGNLFPSGYTFYEIPTEIEEYDENYEEIQPQLKKVVDKDIYL